MTAQNRKRTRLATKLLWLTAVVLIVPWLGIQSLSSMKQFLLEGQEQAQLLTARGAAAVLGQRPSLFEQRPPGAEGGVGLPLYPGAGRPVLDGYSDDWRPLLGLAQHFGGAGQNAEGPQFSLLMSRHLGMVYGWVSVEDATPVSRHPGILPLDRSDHLRFSFPGDDVSRERRRVLVTYEGNGPAIVYQTGSNWRYADPGTPEYRFRAQVVMTPVGYDVEFRFPLDWLGTGREMGVAAVNVADRERRQIAGVTGTHAQGRQGALNPVIIRSAEMEQVLADFARRHARLWVLDRHNRVRALVGDLQGDGVGYRETSFDEQPTVPWWQMLFQQLTGHLVGLHSGPFEDFDAATVHSRNDGIYHRALAGEAVVARRASLDRRAEIVTAAHPIEIGGKVAGVLLLEKSTHHLLQLQRRSLETLVGLTVLGTALVSLLLLLFAWRLAWRIGRLGRDAAANVDDFGRFTGGRRIRGLAAGDEIGQLSRTIHRMLARLRQHQGFLKNIPRTLRHEINNPLNTVATSLDCIERGDAPAPYLDSARRGLARIGHVVNALSEAASLEEALRADDREPLDFAALLRVYIGHQSRPHQTPIELDAPGSPVTVEACGEHLEEMLDKLLDNARDFSPPGVAVRVSLDAAGDWAVLRISNEGAPIAADQLGDLFQFMSSGRGGDGHFGLGLYVVKVIVEHHGGGVSAENCDGGGVCFTVRLPLAT